MKKLLSYFVIALLAIGFVSCKKDHTCKCDIVTVATASYELYDEVVTTTTTDTETSESTIKDTKKKAEEKCEDMSAVSNSSEDESYYTINYKTTKTCKLQ